MRRRFAPAEIVAAAGPRRKSLPAIRQCHSDLTQFLNDPDNLTGYSQVLRQTTTDQSAGQIQSVVTYAIGSSLISQTTTPYTNGVAGTPQALVFGYDGHGSVRMLLDMTAAIATVAGVQQIFDYDAYGNLLDVTPFQAATTILYSGQMLDPNTGLYDNRARWYDPQTGRFTQLDSFFGNLRDPQTLHKYLYANADPVNGIDPTGHEELGETLGSISISSSLSGMSLSGVAGAAGRALSWLGETLAFGYAVLKLQEITQPVVPLPGQKVRHDYDYALLAQAAYEGASQAAVQARGWQQVVPPVTDPGTGFNARLYRRNGETVLAFAGTGEPFLADWQANFEQAFLGTTAQYEQAMHLVQNLQNQGMQIDRFVGHSTGGGMASAAAVVYNLPATTFNAAGVNPFFVAQYGANLANANQLIDAYRVQGDILSTLQDLNPALVESLLFSGDPILTLMGVTGEAMPDGVGKALWLPGHSFDPFTRHRMSAVLRGMQEMM